MPAATPYTPVLDMYKRDITDCDQAQNPVLQNLPLVLHIARRYKGFGVDLEDLVQAGNEGLIRALEKYDPARGEFGIFAAHLIQGAVLDEINAFRHRLHVPRYKMEQLARMRKHKAILSRLEEEVTVERLAVLMNLSTEMVTELQML